MWFIFLSCSDKADNTPDLVQDSAHLCDEIQPHALSFGNDGQGIDTNELESAELIAEHLLNDPNIAFVTWRNASTTSYTVHLQESSSLLEWTSEGFTWTPVPSLNSDVLAYSSLNAELSAGNNPNNASINGYQPDDPRLSFIPLDNAVWPKIEERIAQLFENPNSPDITYAIAPYARGGTGSHGGLSLAQSRAPLLMRGPGIKPGVHTSAARHIDIAPTIAALLGVEPVGSTHLVGQDGQVLSQLLQDCAQGAAENAVLIILDGLSHTELYEALSTEQLPQIGRIFDTQSAWLDGGSIVGWPSFSFPGHVSIHMGSYQGHNGIISNSFWNRAEASMAPAYSLSTLLADPQAAQQTQERYLSNEHETLFEAIQRQFPEAQTASINELTFRGATYSRLAETLPQTPPPPDTLEYELADASAILQFQNMVDDIGLPKFLSISLYLTDAAGQDNGPHGDDLRTALIDTDARLQSIFDAYESADLIDKTLFFITADHGMELQDPTRTAQTAGLSDLDIPHIQLGQLIYLNP